MIRKIDVFASKKKSWHACIIDLDTAKKIIINFKNVLKISLL